MQKTSAPADVFCVIRFVYGEDTFASTSSPVKKGSEKLAGFSEP